MGHRFLGGGGDLDLGVRVRKMPALRSESKPGAVGSAETRLATMASAPLRWSLARAFCEEVGGLGGESYDEGVGVAAGDGLGEDVGGGLEFEGDGAVALDLLVG